MAASVNHATRDVWLRILSAVVPLLVLGGIALITMRNELSFTQRQVDRKASAEAVQSINARLDRIEGKLDRIIEER